ncbi:MAG: sensor domain-containing diguanylate cyclase [Candidatus Dormibacteria bacterium]
MDADVGALSLPAMYQLRRVAITGPLFAGGMIVIASAAVVPVAGHVVGPTTSFVPAMLAVVLCFDLMSTYLLITNFLDTGELRMLLMAGAYLWSMVLLSGYALAFPGVIASVPPFGAVYSTAPWLYVGWHVGFPALLAVAWAPLPKRLQRTVPGALRRVRCWRIAGSVVVVAAVVVALCVHFAREMPTLIIGSSTSLMTRITAPYALPIVASSLLIAWWGLQDRTGPERWTTTAILICFCDLMLTYFSETRYSVGWYLGRGLTMAGAGVVLFAMFRSFRQLKAQAEVHAATDSLTGLPNRRTLDAKLNRELSRARRLGAPLSVLLLDLDGFKQLNDIEGHAAGDQALQAVAAAWSAQLRPNDLLCRTGGDEFAVVLPDTTEEWADALALRLKAMTPPSTGVSIGVASWNGQADTNELLASADREMYRSKSQRLSA